MRACVLLFFTFFITTQTQQCTFMKDYLIGLSHLPDGKLKAPNASICCNLCFNNSKCISYSFTISDNMCYLKDNINGNETHPDRTSGTIPSRLPKPVNVELSISTNVVSTTDLRYVSWTIDPSSNRQFFEFNFADDKLRYLAAQLPTYVRVGGSGEDYLTYEFGNTTCKDTRCLNATHWDNLYSLVHDAGAKMVFGLNECPRTNIIPEKIQTTCDDVGGTWDSTNAREFLKYSISKGYTFFGFELGNERNGQISADTQAKDFKVLSELLIELYPDTTTRPLLFGPDAHSFKDNPKKWSNLASYIKEFIHKAQELSIPIGGITHHEYIEVLGASSYDPARLNLTSQIAILVNNTVHSVLPKTSLWAGEIGPHNGGSAPCDHTSMRWANFANSFWYSYALGAKALNGYSVFARQDFIGIDYGMLDCLTFDPLPDYYVGLLFHRLMGPNVLRAIGKHDTLRSFAHCGKDGGTSLLLINLDNSMITVTISGVLSNRIEYHLTAPKGVLGTAVALNGALLKLDSKAKLPALTGMQMSGSSPIKMSPLSIAFIVLPEMNTKICP